MCLDIDIYERIYILKEDFNSGMTHILKIMVKIGNRKMTLVKDVFN